jgi:hypothetical protein
VPGVVDVIRLQQLDLQRDGKPVLRKAPATAGQHLAALDHFPAGQRLQPKKSRTFSASHDFAQASNAALTLASFLSSPVFGRGRMPSPMMLLTSAATPLAACGLLRTSSRARSRSNAPAR